MQLPSSYSPELRALIASLLAKAARDRPSASDLLSQPILRHRMALSPPPDGFISRERPSRLATTDSSDDEQADTEEAGRTAPKSDPHASGHRGGGGSRSIGEEPLGAERAGVCAQELQPSRARWLTSRPLALAAGATDRVTDLIRLMGRRRPVPTLSIKPPRRASQRSCPLAPQQGLSLSSLAVAEEATYGAAASYGGADSNAAVPGSATYGANNSEWATGAVGVGAAGSCSDEWYYLDADGVHCGPVDEEMLLLLHVLGDVSDETRVWREGMERWEAMHDVPDLASACSDDAWSGLER